MAIRVESNEWRNAISSAPDKYEIHTVIERVKSGPQGRETWREVVVGRRIVSDGVTLFDEKA